VSRSSSLVGDPFDAFDAFYRELHADDDVKRTHGPYRWQRRIAAELAGGRLPAILEAPTGAGKTTLIEAFLFALGWQLAHGERTLPLRLFWIVDRRSVVDQAFAHASAVARRIGTATGGDDMLTAVRRALASPRARPRVGAVADPMDDVQCQRWRGATGLRPTTLRPDIPAIVCSTVDQVGSRLLFRGYGVGRGSRPVDAALVGTDSLIVVDEAHIAQPFVETAERAAAIQRAAVAHPGRPLHVMRVSATLGAPTGGADDGAARFRLTSDELAEPPLARRIDAQKRVRVGRMSRTRVSGLVAAAHDLAESAALVGVVANTVGEARKVHAELSKRHAALLLIGPARSLDREALLSAVPGRSERVSREPLFVVATQTIEVGVDLDFDALASSCAPLDALAQRLGRLDRAGAVGVTDAVVVHSEEECRVYGGVTASTWKLLTERAAEDGSIDLGPRRVSELLAELTADERAAVLMPERNAPLLAPWVVDALTWTSDEPAPSPRIDVFLHGDSAEPSADVSVVWRSDLADLPSDERVTAWSERVRARPPHPGEAISLPIGTVRRWLVDDPDAGPLADIESLTADGATTTRPAGPAFVLVAPNARATELNVTVSHDVRAIEPGATIVVPSGYGGCDRFGWIPGAAIGHGAGPTDQGDLDPAGLRLLLDRSRLTAPAVQDETGAGAAVRTFAEALGRFPDDATETSLYAALRPLGLTWLESQIAVDAPAMRRGGAVDEARHDQLRMLHAELASAETGTVTTIGFDAERPPGDATAVVLVPIADSRESRRARRPVRLVDHAADVAHYARRFASVACRDERLVASIEAAGRYHDHGKLDPRFQRWMFLSRPVDGNAPRAKSGIASRSHSSTKHRIAAGWPAGKRHETTSAALVRASPLRSDASVDLDLVTHAILAHHGHNRPLLAGGAAAEADTTAVEAEIAGTRVTVRADEAIDWPAHASRFERLNQAHSPWGLAMLEASVVLADWQASIEEQA
jgi:CRISPR-associated endonuclease/helicase Cas3